ncbi:MAG: response regulator [Proteobacteria bacterium]|jgi:excisionase family DNA binding protein|nr:response regulator [Pseudomonadota bacterium]
MKSRIDQRKLVFNAPDKPYLTPNEVASLFMVSPITVRQWAQKGLLKAEVTVGGHRRFLRAEVERFARDHRLAGTRADSQSGHARLLVVDDDRQLVGYIRELLSDIDNLEVETAYDGFDAGTKMQVIRPHIVLLDLMMPGLNGFEVCQRIKADHLTRDTRVITMTGFASSENTGRSIAAGAERCLSKPLNPEALLAFVREAISHLASA